MLEKLQLLKDSQLLLYCLVHLMFELAYDLPNTFLPELMFKDHKFPKSVKGTIMAVFGISQIVGNLPSIIIAKFCKKKLVIISAITMVCIGCACIGLAFCSRYEIFIVVTIALGLFWQSTDYYIVHILKDMYGIIGDKFQDAYGLVMLAKVPGPSLGPPLAGALHDFFGGYYITFYSAAIFLYIAALFNFLLFFIRLSKK